VVVFNSIIGIQNYAGSANADGTVTLAAADQTSVTNAVALSSNVPLDAVTFVSASQVVRRVLRKNGMRVLSINIQATTKTTQPLAAGQTADDVYNAANAALTAAVTSGALNNNLATQAATNGAASLNGAIADSATTTAPVVINPSSDSSDDDDLSGGAIAGIVIAVVVVFLLIVGALWFFLCKSGASEGSSGAHKPIKSSEMSLV
jgi:hypothetical protein